MTRCRVLQPGMLTSVQDRGRSGVSALGVPPGGAADALSLVIGNRLVGNPDDAAALECTLTGPSLTFDADTHVAITGAFAESTIDDLLVAPWKPQSVRAGQVLRIGTARSGCRTYVCIRGGVQCPLVMGSRSTLLSAGFGGMNGRALRADDTLPIGEAAMSARRRPDLSSVSSFLARRVIRAIETPHGGRFARDAANRFWSTIWSVSNHSDRMGVRLEGPPIPTLCAGRMQSEGMPHGAIEIPDGGHPIALGVEHPTTGGYPPIACIAAIDLPLLGQLRPRDSVRFERIARAEALALLGEQSGRIDALLPPV